MIPDNYLFLLRRCAITMVVLCSAFILVFCSGGDDEGELTLPAIASFSPASGDVGSTVIISGSNFSATASENMVKFNGTTAAVSSASATSLTVTVPSGATTGKIMVTVNGKATISTEDFDVTKPVLSITGFSPSGGRIGSVVIITGTNLSDVTAVEFNGIRASGFQSTGNTQITAYVPLGATNGKISVTVAGQTVVSDDDFKVTVPIIDMAAGKYHTYFLTEDEDRGSTMLFATGSNQYGQLGDGTTKDAFGPKQIDLNIKAIAVGDYHSLMIKTDNKLNGTGYNGHGELGLGTTTNFTFPVKIMSDIQQAVAGNSHTLILKTDNSLWGTGANHVGQLGDGSKTGISTPKQITTNVQAVVAGTDHSLILKTNHTLWAAGYNKYGQLGDGTTTDVATFKQILTEVKAVAAGSTHTLIVRTDNTLWATGANGVGQLGDGTLTDVTSPKKIMDNVKAVKAAGNHTIILKTDNTLWVVGNNESGQLGNGTTTNITTPQQVMSDVQAVASGHYHTLVVKSDGTLWATGLNYYGQLGLSATTNATTSFKQVTF